MRFLPRPICFPGVRHNISFASDCQGHYISLMSKNALLLDSITDADADSAGRIAVSGSHGGVYPAAVASKWGIRAVLFNDAGIGHENAGVAGVLKLAGVGMAAAALDCQSCRIGSAADAVARGRVSIVNDIARDLGLATGMAVSDALAALDDAPAPAAQLPPVTEARRDTRLSGSGLLAGLLDSASLVNPGDAGTIVITGSHGGLIGGDPARALKADARVAVFNDAGVGIDGIGITRLAALDQRGVAAVTVDCRTARIGDAASALETGVISFVNRTAERQGAQKGTGLRGWLEALAEN